MRLDYSGERFMPGWGGPGIHLEHLHRYSLAATVVDGAVLDLGCGIGYGSRLLARGARRVVGIDSSPPAIGFAGQEFGAANLEYLAGDARALPFPPATFDWVVCFELIEHLQEGEAVVAEIARVLAPQGRLLLSTPNRPIYSEARGWSNPFHRREFTSEELRGLLAAAFDDVVIYGQRLVAGSVVWDLGREAPRGQFEALQPAPGLAPGLSHEDGPTYLLALCARRRGRRPQLASESIMAGRLEAFIEEEETRAAEVQAGLRAEYQSAEAAVRAEYQTIVDRLVAQLGEFDARIRQLGGQVDFHHAARQKEVASLSDQLAEERSRAVSLEAERGNLETRLRELRAQTAAAEAQGQERLPALSGELAEERSRRTALEAEVGRLAAELADSRRQSAALDEGGLDELRWTLEKTRADLEWSYWRWQTRESELATIQQSKMWRLWMAYQAARRAVLFPVAFGRRLARAAARRVRWWSRLALRLPLRALGWLYLVSWTAGAWLRAVWRGRRPSAAGASSGLAAPSLSRRPRVLFVCPYQLYPADHGGGVRIYNLVRRLSRHCDLYLLIFIQGEDDPEQRRALAPWVQKLYFHHWRPQLQPDLLDLKPRGVQLFEAPAVRSLIGDILSRERIDVLQLEYTELGQYGLPRYARVKVVLSEIDIAFRSSARRRRAGLHRRYRLGRIFGYSWADWMRQFRYELRVTRRADQVHVMSDVDGAYLARFLPDGRRRIRVVPNAVDVTEYRPPEDSLRRGRQLLFVGNFEHLPNLDALDYLLGEIWPRVRRRVPAAELVVVGARAGEGVQRYDGRDGVTVMGAVPETRPYYQQCRALVAPIRAGSGTRLKILEALACATPVVTTSIGAEGIDGIPGQHFLIADTAADFSVAVCRLLEDDELSARLGQAGRQLVEQSYSWEQSAAAVLAGYAELLAGEAAADGAWQPPRLNPEVSPPADQVDVSVVIPTLNGGAVLERCLAAVRRQQTRRAVEITCVDSGSSAEDLAMMERSGARVIRIDRAQFNHGLTRDLGAAASRGRVLAFLNQDAVPCDSDWLEHLVAPLFTAAGCVAVQGAILEVPERERRFFWDSCGDRFYFTRESKRWLESYFGIGFSTVNAAIRRDAWERYPFGYAPIMEDKKWQRAVVAAGHSIAVAPLAAVHHTHNYDMRSLSRRCESEGFGWRTVGETYSLYDMLADSLRPRMYADLLRGLARGEIRSWAELLFPLLRPWLVFRGNRWGQALRA